MTQSHHSFVNAAYSPRASDYVSSTVHATGEDLDQVEALVRGHSKARALDMGCGGGHVCYRVAPHVAEVVAIDLSSQMLEAVSRTAAERGLNNVTTKQGAAESLPLPDQQFDFVLSRFSAHHWRDLDAGLREARRVATPDGRALFIDSVSPAAALLDTHQQTIELLRDPSHVRNYTSVEWVSALARAGFEVVSIKPRKLRIEFASWISRTRTPPALADAIRSLLQGAPTEVREHFAVETDGSFLLDTMAFEAKTA